MKINPWVRTALIATLGGGISAAFAAAMDPSRYHFPKDIGSGKLWEFFFEGAVSVGAATLVKSPLGQRVMTSFKESQQQLADGKQTVEKTRADLKASVTPKPDQK